MDKNILSIIVLAVLILLISCKKSSFGENPKCTMENSCPDGYYCCQAGPWASRWADAPCAPHGTSCPY